MFKSKRFCFYIVIKNVGSFYDYDDTWFTLKSGWCAQEASQAHYSFGKLRGYKSLYCNKYYETQI